jgi:hypothetical protein
MNFKTLTHSSITGFLMIGLISCMTLLLAGCSNPGSGNKTAEKEAPKTATEQTSGAPAASPVPAPSTAPAPVADASSLPDDVMNAAMNALNEHIALSGAAYKDMKVKCSNKQPLTNAEEAGNIKEKWCVTLAGLREFKITQQQTQWGDATYHMAFTRDARGQLKPANATGCPQCN